jgi:membrane protease YdiL (CAAX protease family)
MITILEILALFVLPVLPGFVDSVPKKYRFPIFTTVILITAAIVIIERWPLVKLGIDTSNLLNGIWLYAGFTLLGIAGLIALAKILKFNATPEWWKQPHFLFGFILMSVGQEFLYRGFLMPELASVFPAAAAVILVNALLFTFIHAIYPNKLVNLTTIFLGGLGFAGIYYFYPNLIMISLSHMILNFVAVYFGFFSFRDREAH